jgi:hypothetical protein
MNATESCTVVSWCDQPAGHRDRHVRLVGLVEPSGFNTISAILVTVEAGPAESEPLPVVGGGGGGPGPAPPPPPPHDRDVRRRQGIREHPHAHAPRREPAQHAHAALARNEVGRDQDYFLLRGLDGAAQDGEDRALGAVG